MEETTTPANDSFVKEIALDLAKTAAGTIIGTALVAASLKGVNTVSKKLAQRKANKLANETTPTVA